MARSKTRISGILQILRIFFSNFYKSVFSILTCNEYRKLGFKKIRDFQTSVFSIFTMGVYRKHGCLKISDFLKSQFSIFTRQMFENPRFSNIRLFDIYHRSISKTRMFENLGVLKSKFSIFTADEYRKHGFMKVGEKISAISETSAFSIWPLTDAIV